MIFNRTPINYLLVNLAVADALFAIFVTSQTFFKITPTHPGGIIDTAVCKLSAGGALAWIAGYCSVVTLLAIAVERYYAVIYPAGNVGKLTKRKLKVRHFHKHLLDEVFVIFRIIKVEVGVIRRKPKKKWKSFFCLFTDGTQDKARELDIITLRSDAPWSYMT